MSSSLSDGLLKTGRLKGVMWMKKQFGQHEKSRIHNPALAADYLRRRSPGSGISAHFTILATSAGLSS